jgi:hypothetical protein
MRTAARILRLTRRSRQLLLACVALFALFTAPVAATLHELQHLSPDPSSLDQKQHESKSSCELCSAYAQLGHALSAAGAADFAAAAIADGFVPRNGSVVPPVHFAYRERAPPASLNS